MFVGGQLKEIRKEKGLTLRALAKKANLASFSHIRNIEEGIIYDPSFSIVVKLAKALEISIDELAKEETDE